MKISVTLRRLSIEIYEVEANSEDEAIHLALEGDYRAELVSSSEDTKTYAVMEACSCSACVADQQSMQKEHQS